MLAEVAKPDVGARTSDSCPRGEIRSVPWDGSGDGGGQVYATSVWAWVGEASQGKGNWS